MTAEATEISRISTATLSDALDVSGLVGQCLGLAALAPHFRSFGPAFPVSYEPCTGEAQGTVGDFLDDVPPGAVVVIANNARVDCTVWGGLMTARAKRMGLAGTVIDGACRDLAEALQLDYPLFTRGVYMRTGKGRVRVAGVNVPVQIAGVDVRPGDYVGADIDGVVVVARERIVDVSAVASQIQRKEELVLKLLNEGVGLREARASVNYHQIRAAKKA